MWTNPQHRTERPPPEQPEEHGHILLCLDRPRGEELHIGLAEYNGYPYINIRVWQIDGQMRFPTKKGMTLKRGEIPQVIAALNRASAILSGFPRGKLPQSSPAVNPDPHPHRQLPGPAPAAPPFEPTQPAQFDEFDDQAEAG